MASFGREFIGRQVIDSNGDSLGSLNNLLIDTRSGIISELLVDLGKDIDPTKLPWPSNNGICIDSTLIVDNGVCTEEWNPVCGCNGVTYSNSCHATIFGGVTTYVPGECCD